MEFVAEDALLAYMAHEWDSVEEFGVVGLASMVSVVAEFADTNEMLFMGQEALEFMVGES
jgi:hypothetical protein